MNGKRSTGSGFTSVSLMTLKELNKSHSKNSFGSFTRASNNNHKLPKSATKKPAAKSFLAQVLSPDLNKSYASNTTSSAAAAQFLPVLNKKREKSKISIANTSSSVTSQNLNRFVEAQPAQADLVPEMANIFNLKTVQQHESELAELLAEKERLKQEALNAENGASDADDGQDNVSYCSEATVEFCREATEYFLEDQNRVENQNMFMSEPKFHRAFQVESTAYLPSLRQLQNRKNTEAEDFYEPPEDKNKDFSCEAIYLETCRRQKLIPASYFVRHLKDSEITLKHHGLGAPGIRPVSAALMNSGEVTKLDLSDNWLGAKGAEYISRMLKENCFICELNLSDNRLGTEGSERLREILKNNSSLTHLTFQGNKFDDASAAVWGDIIANNLRIEYLDLSHNNFGEDSGKLLGNAIAENSSIQDLNLGWNNIRRKGAIGIAKGLSANSGMKKFSIGWNGLSQDGAKAFFKVLKDNECLEELDLSNNRIATEGAVYIAKGLISNTALKVIKMGMNPMESAGCFSIIKGLQKNPETKLEFIDFTDILVDKFFVEEFKLFQATFPNIKVRTGSDGIILKPKAKVHPIVKLRNFFDKKNMKLVDFFTKYDKDGSMTVSKEEFKSGIMEMEIKLLDEEIEQLLTELDPENDGEINYRKTVETLESFADKKSSRKSTKSGRKSPN